MRLGNPFFTVALIMSIQKDCILRYRTQNHVRFQVPTVLCQRHIAEKVAAKIAAIEGVYRVNFYAKQHKISIRYKETVCDFPKLLNELNSIFSTFEKSGSLTLKTEKKSTFITQFKNKISQKADNFKATRWMKEKTVELKETVQAAKIITKLGLKKPKSFIKDPEKAIIDFLNDILVLFLIRLHWDHITRLWLLNPFKFRYEWLATFYMFFLLIRSRRPRQ